MKKSLEFLADICGKKTKIEMLGLIPSSIIIPADSTTHLLALKDLLSGENPPTIFNLKIITSPFVTETEIAIQPPSQSRIITGN